MYEVLKRINGPEDLKHLSRDDLKVLAQDIRDALMNKLSKAGGHFGPNFGMVEVEIALHYVFNSPIDKIVYDVSHQAYPHKMLTGRKDAYLDENYFHDVSGYTNPEENEHDFFNIGHTSTAVSLAAGLAKGRDLLGGQENIIAIVGDGSLSGGEALEGLDFAGSELNSNFIIIVNDNQQSISEVHGGLYKNLDDLRETKGTSSNNLFKAMGLDYCYVDEGNNLDVLIEAFEKIKDIDHPIVVHINTKKGKGYELAEQHKEMWHFTMPFNPETGELLINRMGPSYSSLTADFILEKIKKDPKVVFVTAGVAPAMGFIEPKRKEAGEQFVDVGIAEEHAVALVSGIAKNGGKPIFGTHASFMQRTYDQMSQDLCINNNSATILVNTPSVFGMNDVTHLGIFNTSIFSNIPNLVILAPTSKIEYLAMLDWSIEQDKYPVMIAMPSLPLDDKNEEVDKDYSNINTFKVTQKGEKVAIIALGDFYGIGEKVAIEIEKTLGFKPTLINPRFASGMDKNLLTELKNNHQVVITLENGVLEGGFGYKVTSYYGPSDMKVKNYGLEKEFYDRYNANELLDSLGITPEKIAKDVKGMIN